MGGETDLFGNPVVPLPARKTPRRVVNDMEVVERVLKQASTEKFMVVGEFRQQVYRCTTGDEVEEVPAETEAVVHQLLDAGWLEIGGTHQVRYGRLTGPARSVLVPTKSRRKSERWSVLSKPAQWEQRRKSA
ncbi:hypothetical protein [Saccharopolyspora sp. 6V]|uniref:hypothetical protein n=1 Tax=Saccharopolyspora sp. 6V TaxID=2877239 RepID=UPI001CD7FA06|nr:hypothetical protein [Saccharopolyspora sp. 6V]MCA1195337.1 hypothetical protein [Saccharopolyspora sp. 6V]